eukprot:2525524-Pyramimonas_sp.AAC.1
MQGARAEATLATRPRHGVDATLEARKDFISHEVNALWRILSGTQCSFWHSHPLVILEPGHQRVRGEV